MVLQFEATHKSVIRSGLYPAEMMGLEFVEGVTGPFLQWLFRLTVDGEELVLPLPTSTKVGPGTTARRLIETLLGRRVTEGETVAIGALQGTSCQILVTAVHRDGSGPANKIAGVIPASVLERNETDVPF
jgi:hypothetical protein